MEKAYDSVFLHHHHHLIRLLPPLTTAPFPPPSRNSHIPTLNDRKPMRDLGLKRVKIAINPFRLNNLSSPFCAAAMADANKKGTESDDFQNPVKDAAEANKDLDKSKKINVPPPPPPEKPLPGDCCGSGCVRCVWDVYYEELDAYNKLHNNSS